jgi:hypothetical protein
MALLTVNENDGSLISLTWFVWAASYRTQRLACCGGGTGVSATARCGP